jgi:hypothetical protein
MPIDPGRRRYFSTISKTALKRIASRGGKIAWERGNPHRYTKAEAKASGSKGGLERARKFRELRELEAQIARIENEQAQHHRIMTPEESRIDHAKRKLK